MVISNLVVLFFALYIDIRIFVFQIHLWAHFLNTFALLLMWLGGGHQRTEILLKTNAYYKLHNKRSIIDQADDTEEYDIDEIKAFFWKFIIMLYEVAQVINIFSIFTFWIFWSHKIFEFQRLDHTDGNEGREVAEWRRMYRLGFTLWINSITPTYMFIDFLLSKLIFKLRHFVIQMLIALLFLGIYGLGEHIITDPRLFPLKRQSFFNNWTPVAFIFIALIHMLLSIHTKVRFNMTKDPRDKKVFPINLDVGRRHRSRKYHQEVQKVHQDEFQG